MIALAAEALPIVRRISPDSSMIEEIGAVASDSIEATDRRMSALNQDAARFLGMLDRLSAFADQHADSDDAEIGALGRRVDDELRAIIARRATWIGGGG
jgi:hypothetical protein